MPRAPKFFTSITFIVAGVVIVLATSMLKASAYINLGAKIYMPCGYMGLRECAFYRARAPCEGVWLKASSPKPYSNYG